MKEMSPEHVAAARANLARAWREAQEFAKKHELEYFLDKPSELNRLIMKLIKLEKDMQFAQQRHKYEGNPEPQESVSDAFCKYAQGKRYILQAKSNMRI